MRQILFLVLVVGVVCFVIGCAPAAAPPPPTSDAAMMAKETDTAMMQATDTAMMAKGTDTAMSPTTQAMASGTDTAMGHDGMMMELPPEKVAMHFVDSMPMHGETLAAIPKLVQINFNSTLGDGSTITVDRDGKELVSDLAKLDAKGMGMSIELPADAGAGVYVVKFKACWLDKSCHEGQFAFTVK